MEIKHNDVLVSDENPFENCKLERKQYADVLTSIIAQYKDGFVLALNGEWGTGKTTFVKMWQQDLINRGFATLLFNAWENDLQSDPMIAILGELRKLIGEKDDTTFKKVLKNGAIVAKNILPGVAKALVKKYADLNAISDIVENSIKATTEIFSQEVDEYSKKKEDLDNFRISLSEYVFNQSEGRPIVFIIDELDRCRPNYAVEVLEKIKHFFSVRGIVFVLAIDKEQLGNSIKGYYGSDCINSEEYLRRFIDIEYKLPLPNSKLYCEYLYSYFGFTDFFESENRQQYFDSKKETIEFLEFSSQLVYKQNLSLRQIEKLFAHCRIALHCFAPEHFTLPSLFLFLTFLKNHKPSIYNNIATQKYSIQELANALEDLMEVCTHRSSNNYRFIELLTLYARYKEGYYYVDSLYEKEDSTENKTLLFETRIKDTEYVFLCIDDVRKRYRDGDILNHLLTKIDLYSNFES